LSLIAVIKEYLKNALRWQSGRQKSGYDKMLLLQSMWPLPFDVYILRFPEGSEIKPHTDPVSFGRHFRLNIVLKQAKVGGEFQCKTPLFQTKRIKFFRPDACEHSVSKLKCGTRYVLSIGWVLSPQKVDLVKQDSGCDSL
jgi:hypothetical protein